MATKSAKEEAFEYFRRGYEHQMKGELDEAVACYKKSIAIFPTAEAHTFLGWTCSFTGQYDEAIQECLRAIEVDPTFGNPYNDIGAYLIEMGRLDEAIAWFEKACQAPRYESYCFPHFNLGRVYERKHQYRKALEEYKRALAENPGYVLATQAIRKLQAMMN